MSGAAVARRPTNEAFLAGNALRGLACSQILLFHAAFGAAQSDGLHPAVIGDTSAAFKGAFGWFDNVVAAVPLAVYIFFSLSGYLLARRFVQAFIDGDPRPSVVVFLRNRALRILPALWFVIGLSLVVFGAHGSTIWQVLALPLCVQVFVQGPVNGIIAHAWTIDTEWALYLGLPLVAVLGSALAGPRLSRRGRYALVGGALVVVYVVSLGFRARGPVDTDYQRAFWAASWSFIPGIALALVEVAWAERLRGATWGPRVALGLWVLWGLFVAAFVRSNPGALGQRAVLATTATTLMLGAPLLMQWTTGRCWRALDNRPLRWLGERSYSVYLLQFIIGLEVTRHLGFGAGQARSALILTVPLTFALTLVASELSYRWIEAPFLIRKRRQAPTAGAPLPAGVAGDDLVAT